MANYAPPSGPPPPRVPDGWKAVWNDQYKEWFYVNVYTNKSQWDKPTEPVHPASSHYDAPPSGAPPGYDHSSSANLGPEKSGLHGPGQGQNMSEDERLARQLQAEEQARASSSRGASDSYYGGGGGGPPGQSAYGQDQGSYGGGAQQQDQKRGMFSKLTSKFGGGSGGMGSSPRPPGYGGGGMSGYPPPQQHGYGGPQGYPPQGGGYGGYPPQGYPPQAYGQQPMYAQQAPKKSGLGGIGGGALLGAGGGLLLGGLIGEEMGDAGDGGDGGGDDGGDYGGDGGGDYGGGDDGGGGDF